METILAIATNSAPLLHGRPTGLWLSELTHFLAVIEDAGFRYDLASPAGGKIPIDERRKSLAAQVQNDSINARFMNDESFVAQLQESRKQEIQRLNTDQAGIKKERQVIEQHLAQVKQQLARARQLLAELLKRNSALADELAAIQLRAAGPADRPLALGTVN